VVVATAGDGQEDPVLPHSRWLTRVALLPTAPQTKGKAFGFITTTMGLRTRRTRRKVRCNGLGEVCQDELDCLSPMY
jgi:hypothetical protein